MRGNFYITLEPLRLIDDGPSGLGGEDCTGIKESISIVIGRVMAKLYHENIL